MGASVARAGHVKSVIVVIRMERALFCQHWFVFYAMVWKASISGVLMYIAVCSKFDMSRFRLFFANVTAVESKRNFCLSTELKYRWSQIIDPRFRHQIHD